MTLEIPSTAPIPRVEIAFTTRPTEAPTWTDITAYIESFSIRRGKQGPLESVGISTVTLRLLNTDRRFDPTYAAGPYYGNLKSTRRARIRAEWPVGTTNDLIHFYVDSWPPRRENYGHQFVEVTGSDALSVFARANVTTTRPQERTDQRIAALLGEVNWTTGQGWVLGDATFGVLGSTTFLAPVGDRALDQGAVEVQAATLSNEGVLAHFQAVERTEMGAFFVSKSGAVTLHNRQRRQLAGSTAVVATFGEVAPEIPYRDVALEFDNAELWNDFTVTRPGGTDQRVTDAGSILDHFPLSLSWATLATSDGESATIGGYLRNRFATQRLRIPSLVLQPDEPSGETWRHLMERDLGEVVLVRHTPLGSSGPTERIEQVSFIDGIALDWRAEGNVWAAEWLLSAADTTRYWVLGQSLLGVDTTLAL